MNGVPDAPIKLSPEDWSDDLNLGLSMLSKCGGPILSIDASVDVPVCAQVAQLLVSAQQTAEANSWGFEIINTSQQVRDSLSQLGLGLLFEGRS